MAQEYEEIVRQWYVKLRPEFLRRLTAKYSGLSLEDAENLYQDTFIAVQENLMLGRVKEDTSWSSYIMTIGMNMASKEWRKIGKTDSADEGFDNDEEEIMVTNATHQLPSKSAITKFKNMIAIPKTNTLREQKLAILLEK